MATVASVEVGLARDVEWQGKTVQTTIRKRPETERVFAERLNLVGDAQADVGVTRVPEAQAHGLSSRSHAAD